nr:MAG: replication associated protein [Cressdnaviricota sp.]
MATINTLKDPSVSSQNVADVTDFDTEIVPNDPDFLNARGRRFVFTFHNWKQAHIERFNKWAIGQPQFTYMCYGKENCPSTGREHLQGYICFTNARTESSVIAILSGSATWKKAQQISNKNNAWVRVARAGNQANIRYCSKTGDFTEYGTPPLDQSQKGELGKICQKKKWQEIRDLCLAGDDDAIMENHPSAYFHIHGNLEKIRRTMMGDQPGLKRPISLWVYGGVGLGKSTLLRSYYSEAETYIKPMNKWWDQYMTTHKIAVFEDWSQRHEHELGDLMKIWADSFAFSPEGKGTTLPKIRPMRFIVTSQFKLEDAFTDQDTIYALNRRFKQINRADVDFEDQVRTWIKDTPIEFHEEDPSKFIEVLPDYPAKKKRIVNKE